jgi:hypothetical protein
MSAKREQVFATAQIARDPAATAAQQLYSRFALTAGEPPALLRLRLLRLPPTARSHLRALTFQDRRITFPFS